MYSGQGLTLAVLAKIIVFCLKFSLRKKIYLYRRSEISVFNSNLEVEL